MADPHQIINEVTIVSHCHVIIPGKSRLSFSHRLSVELFLEDGPYEALSRLKFCDFGNNSG